MTIASILDPIGWMAPQMPRPVAVCLLLLVSVTAGADTQLVQEPQGKPATTTSSTTVPPSQGQTQTTGGQQQAPVQPQPATTQSNVRIGEPGNIVRLVGATTQVVLTMSGLTAADKLSGTTLSQFGVTTQQLDFLMHQTANVAAFIWAVVSLAIGVTYVYSDVDFGTPIDLLGMFLWGLGLTAFGAGIQQVTPRQVATQIGVVVPRSAARETANP